MKISTRGRYALRLMLELAMREQEPRYISIKESGSPASFRKYLEQIVTRLGRGGMVCSARGPAGGYRLARPPEEYTIGEILRLMEGDLSPVPEPNPDLPPCAVEYVWKKLSTAINDVVDHITLQDLVHLQHEMDKGKG